MPMRDYWTCPTCGERFGGVRGFDLHRSGTYRPMTRHCLSPAAIEATGELVRNKDGAWIRPTAFAKESDHA